MGSHGKTGLTKLLLGSVSQSVSIYAPCSVLITREILSDEDLDELKQEEAEARGYKPDDGFDVDFRPHVHPGGM
ncbi:MAG: Universal stress protein family protein [bacterium ADurb.Bin425]|nr:MAG: Universal stress protein family protein [bacterium ADurb.Bin425]